MGDKSAIEWTDATWNPVTGCTEVSPGCDHCYAKTFAERWRGTPGHAYEQGFDLKLWPERLALPLSWKKPRRIFVNSMSDLFHDDIPEPFIMQALRVMEQAEQHTFQVLTKRPDRMRRVVLRYAEQTGSWPPPNVWLGVSVESQSYVWRAAKLALVPAVRFLSCEPLLGPLDLDGQLKWLHWVIVGGESGPGARPMHPDWVRSIRDQCVAAGVPFFFKQWGEYLPGDVRDWRDEPGASRHVRFQDGSIDGHPGARDHWWDDADGNPADRLVSARVGKKRAGRLLDGRTWDEYPATLVPA